MYTIIIGGTLAFLAAFICMWRLKTKFFESLGYGLGGAFFGCAASTILALCAGAMLPHHDVTYGPATLVAMRSADGVSGTFVWGSGRIGQSVSYNFYMRNDDGSLTPSQVDADQLVRIVEDPSLHDVGYWTQVRSEQDTTSLLSKFTMVVDPPRIVSEAFRVPKGTVVQNFSVN